MRHYVLSALALCALPLFSTAAPITFPQNFTPFDSLDYQTVPDQNGYSLVVGETTTYDGMYDLWNYVSSLPAVTGNQYYANQPVELAPGAFFSRVLVPTTAEIQGDFQDFGGAIYDPLSGQAGGVPTQFGVDYNLPLGNYTDFPGNIIPTSLLYGFYAFRVGPDASESSTPEPGAFLLVGLGLIALTANAAKRNS